MYDPRSYSRSVPRISCWATEQRRNLWAVSSPGIAAQYNDPAFLATLQHRARIENSACVDMMGDSGILEHVSTTHSARDLHSLMTALGQEKLRYLGQSYGCLLGTFFASMYPDKVERLVCDGNIDPREVLNGNFATKPGDTDQLLDFFAESCAADEQCLLHLPSSKDVRKRVDTILEYSRFAPAFASLGQWDYNIHPPTFTALLTQILPGAIGNPYWTFGGIAFALALVEQGGMGTAENLLAETPWPSESAFTDTIYRSPHDPDAGRKGFSNKYPITEDWTICNDLPAMPEDLKEFKAILDEARAQDQLAAAVVGQVLNCMGRQVRAKGLYTGKLLDLASLQDLTTDMRKGPFGGNTSHPILFTNARVDPSTSVRMAYSNAEIFTDSSLLVYEAVGVSTLMLFSTSEGKC
jgi:pimeloyl-ACP methyl ester carboxylesterase